MDINLLRSPKPIKASNQENPEKHKKRRPSCMMYSKTRDRLKGMPEWFCIKDWQDITGFNPNSLMQLLNRLEHSGYITRVAIENRIYVYGKTPKFFEEIENG